MPSLLQDHLMRSYFSEEGLEYNMGRVPMAGTDFSIRAYSYMDSEDEVVDCVDSTLQSFQLAQEDFEFKGIWVRDHLGPAINQSAHKNIKIITVDDQRALIPRVLQKIMFDQQTFDMIDGIGLHWYLDSENNTHLLDKTHKLYPTKFMIGTEACAGDFENNVRLGNWTRAELYAKDIIQPPFCTGDHETTVRACTRTPPPSVNRGYVEPKSLQDLKTATEIPRRLDGRTR
uniref:Glucosylceramidase n=1 Tax=Diabrotica virgifera virgifera TaxID=50390 RepID=A0A6P7FUQ0_DIAVI